MNQTTASEVVDEDAAVLQFPKDWYTQTHEDKNDVSRKECFICTIELEEPYIRCAVCDGVEMCPPCFAQGAELKPHENNHAYIVLHDEFPLFDQKWSARDEEGLLDAILGCGFGNWEDISRCLVTHSAEDCEKHYVDTYIECRPSDELPRFRESLLSYYKQPVWAFRTCDMEYPPRHAPGSLGHRTLSGYNAARGDFDIEHDNSAEFSLCEIKGDVCAPSDPDFELISSMQVALFDGYNQRLVERKRRQRVIRKHGLIVMQKTMSWLHRFEMTVTRSVAEKLCFVMQLLSSHELDMLFEGLHAVGHMNRFITKLQEFRTNGLTRIPSCHLYLRLKSHRDDINKMKRNYPPTFAFDWRNTIPQVKGSRRSAGPLDVFGLPGFDRLSENEKELCSTVRIVPVSYLEFKHLLLTESKKHGGLKLAQARSLIKIDVNKTRKLYDFLVKEGYINQSIQATKEFSSDA